MTPAAKVKALSPLIGRMEAAGQIDPAFKARAKTLRDQQSKHSSPK
jgi:RNA-directed DNA polymerase